MMNPEPVCKYVCKCGWLPTFSCSHIQYGKYRCPYIRSKYELKITNNELEYILKKKSD